MWSAGLVLYELVTGRSQGLAKPRLDYDLVPPPLAPAIQRALAEDPEDRTPTITDLRAAILSHCVSQALKTPGTLVG